MNYPRYLNNYKAPGAVRETPARGLTGRDAVLSAFYVWPERSVKDCVRLFQGRKEPLREVPFALESAQDVSAEAPCMHEPIKNEPDDVNVPAEDTHEMIETIEAALAVEANETPVLPLSTLFEPPDEIVTREVRGMAAESVPDRGQCGISECMKIRPLYIKKERKSGFYEYKKWWFMREVEIIVNGSQLTGMPVYDHGAVLRVVNAENSYFIPIDNIDYIATPDGYDASEDFDM